MEKCDCTAFCGDDTWIRQGKAEPCAQLINQREINSHRGQLRKWLDSVKIEYTQYVTDDETWIEFQCINGYSVATFTYCGKLKQIDTYN